ncbi:MAG TPA: hypothetical protein PLE19_19385 [Planctomycetota bacterium]|nr:hypothetical protein [Planctomycetota bacterium]HRR81228.1 hypothetical protein [Planctomycetota bacterium]HRT93541.1 hypothetical protein [Planctomycetota bacterium]
MWLVACRLSLLPACGLAAGNIWQGGSQNGPTDWEVPANWSARKVPAAGDGADVLIPSGLDDYPALTQDAAVGGSLRLAAGASLILHGHSLTVGASARDTPDGPDTAWTPKTPYGLVIEKDAQLDASQDQPTLSLGLGGLVNDGTVSGNPVVRVAGVFHGFVLRLGDLQPAALHLARSPYPYPVRLAGKAAVAGKVEIAGGELIVEKDAALAIEGDLVFSGKTGPACLTPHGTVRLLGDLRSEGSARVLGGAEGWVTLAGEKDQAIRPGGLLPPLRLEKPGGKVALAGDLHCAGLFIAPGNALRLAAGQRLLLGTTAPEWRLDPADKNIVKTWRPHRNCRDLVNQGALLGSPAVPFTLFAHVGGKAYAVSGLYSFARQAAEPKEGEPAQPTAGLHAGDLSLNRPDSRLAIRDGELFLDGQPAARAKKADELDAALEGDGRARLTDLKLTLLPPDAPVGGASLPREGPSRGPETARLQNVAPFVKAIRPSPSVGQSVWQALDGSEATMASFRTGVGLAGSYELVFPRPVPVSRVRFLQGPLFAFRGVVCADTAGTGSCPTVLAAWTEGAPNAWCDVRFAPAVVHRLKLRALEGQRGWEQSFPQLVELEAYGPKEAVAGLEKALPLRAAEPVPKDARRFTPGPPVKVEWPSPKPEDRITKCITADLWMLGIHLETPPPKPLAEFEPCLKVVKDIQALGADGVLLFVEAEMSAFWPSAHFRWHTKDKDAPPPDRDLLRELTDTLHAHGLKLYVIFLGRFMETYIGPKDRDGWQLLMEEVAARGVDGVSLCHDEAFYGLDKPEGKTRPKDDPVRLAFQQRFGPGADLPESIWQDTVDYKRWTLYCYEQLAARFRRLRDAVRKVNPRCETFAIIGSHAVSANNRMTYCLAYDVIGHLADLDYLGTDYQEAETRVWAASARNRRAAMEIFVPPSVREGAQAALQGARLLAWYRYNYIEMQKSADHRRRELAFLAALERWGVTRARTPRALAVLASRASEDWWDNDHGTNWLGSNPVAKQGFWTARLVNQFLNAHGYPYDLYYLDQPESLKEIGQYKVLFLPFPYAVSKAAAEALAAAHAGGSKLLIAQRLGEVDEVGAKHDRPILSDLVRKGRDDGSVVYLPRNLVEWETEPAFTDEFAKALDEVLGDSKPLFLHKHGCHVEAYLAESGPREKFLTLINWQDTEADLEVGLALPEGNYRLLTLSAASPADACRGLLDGKDTASAADLRRFAVKLAPGDVRLLLIQPSEGGP